MKTLINLFFLCSIALFCSAQVYVPTKGHSETYVQDNSALMGGTVYYFGGEKSDGTLSNEMWASGSPDSYYKIDCTDGPSARKDHIAFLSNGKIYIVGGIDSNGNCISDAWEFNIETNTWTQIQSSLAAGNCLVKQTSATFGNSVYIAGGKNNLGETSDNFYSVDLTNPTYPVTQLPNMIEPLEGGKMFSHANNLYYLGGMNSDWDPTTPGFQPSYSRNTWRYSTQKKSGNWEFVATTGEFAELQEFMAGLNTNTNKYYVFGGKTYDYANNQELLNNEIYTLDLTTMAWEKINVPNFPYLADGTATYIPSRQSFIIVGGETYSGAKTSKVISQKIYEFNITSNELSEITINTSIQLPENPSNIKMYFEKQTGNITIISPEKIKQLVIYNTIGQILMSSTNNCQINTSSLNNGIYILKVITTSNKNLTYKFVK